MYAENARQQDAQGPIVYDRAEAGKITGKESRINAISTHQNTASSNATELWTAAKQQQHTKQLLARL